MQRTDVGNPNYYHRVVDCQWACPAHTNVPEYIRLIAQGRYTPSPEQRQRLSAALGVGVDQVVWGHQTQVEHVYGHGPQFGRSP